MDPVMPRERKQWMTWAQQLLTATREGRKQTEAVVEEIAATANQVRNAPAVKPGSAEAIAYENLLRPGTFALTTPLNDLITSVVEDEVFTHPRLGLFVPGSQEKPALRDSVRRTLAVRPANPSKGGGYRAASTRERLNSVYFWLSALHHDACQRLAKSIPEHPVLEPVYWELKRHLEYKRMLRGMTHREEPVNKIFASVNATAKVGRQLADLLPRLYSQYGLPLSPDAIATMFTDNQLIPRILLINNLIFSSLEWIWVGCNAFCVDGGPEFVRQKSTHKEIIGAYESLDDFHRFHPAHVWFDDEFFGLYGSPDRPKLWVAKDVGELMDPFSGRPLSEIELWETLGCPAIIAGVVRRHLKLFATICKDQLLWGSDMPGFILQSALRTNPLAKRDLQPFHERGQLLFDEPGYPSNISHRPTKTTYLQQ